MYSTQRDCLSWTGTGQVIQFIIEKRTSNSLFYQGSYDWIVDNGRRRDEREGEARRRKEREKETGGDGKRDEREGRRREREKNGTSDRRRFGLRQRPREVAACGNGREEVAWPAMLAAAAAAKKLGHGRR